MILDRLKNYGLEQVGSVAVVWSYHLLMLKRRDNGKWTLPGGHLEKGESPNEGAIRELYEETGIRVWHLSRLGCDKIDRPNNEPIIIHSYRVDLDRRPTSFNFDPDGEAQEFKWVPFFRTPYPLELRPENLHVPKNCVLRYLGIQR